MNKQSKLSVEEWHQLTDEKKELIRKWAVKKGFGLEIVNNPTSTTCDYAALLTQEQLEMLSKELGANSDSRSTDTLWEQIKNNL